MEISPETLIYGIFPDTISRKSVFANGGADAQWTISIPKTYSKPIPYSNPNPYPKPNPSLIPKFDKKCLKRNRLAVYGKRTICEFQDITEILRLQICLCPSGFLTYLIMKHLYLLDYL